MSETWNPRDSIKALLRSRAEEHLDGMSSGSTMRLTTEELIHELRTHQIELEMQTETLLATQVELEQSRDRYFDLFEFAPVGYLIISRDGLISTINLSGATMLGKERKRLLNSRFSRLVSSDDRDRWERHFVALLGPVQKQTIEITLQRGDDSSFPARLDCTCMKLDAASQALRVAFSDSTDHTRANQLTEADQRKNEFLAMLAHELRAPLSAISNGVHTLGQFEGPHPRLPWVREMIEQQVAHINHLMDDLLEASRVARDAIVLKRACVTLADVANRALDMAQPLAEAKAQTLDVKLPDRPVHLDADAVRITQVLVNLLDNAVKYTGSGGKIELEARVIERHVEIRVRDSGVGIPAHRLPRIFDLFQQGERTPDRRQGALGIGMALARKLVELHGGRLTAMSAGAKRGAEFIVLLPIWANGGTPPPRAMP